MFEDALFFNKHSTSLQFHECPRHNSTKEDGSYTVHPFSAHLSLKLLRVITALYIWNWDWKQNNLTGYNESIARVGLPWAYRAHKLPFP